MTDRTRLTTLAPYAVEGLELRRLTPAHQAQMMQLQDEVLRALPDPAWYFPSEADEFAQWLRDGEGWGYFDGERLVAYGALGAAEDRGARSYARKLGEDAQGTFDFHDVLVDAAYRGRGIHTKLLALFTALGQARGGRAVYATIDPGNAASWRNFERAGYVCVTTRPAYDGRARRYYRLTL